MSNIKELRDSAIRDKKREVIQREAALEEARAELETLERATPIVVNCCEESGDDFLED